MALFRRYLDLLLRAPGDRRRIVILIALLTFAACLEALGVGLIMPFIALLQRPSLATESRFLRGIAGVFGIETNSGMLIFVGLALLAVFVLKNVYLAATTYLQMRFVFTRMTLLSRDLLAAYLSRRFPFFLQRNSSELVRNVVNDATAIFWLAMPSWFVLIVESITCFILAGLLIVLEPIALPIVGGLLGAGGYAFQRYHRRTTSRLFDRMREIETTLVKYSSDAFGGIKEVRVRGCETFITSTFTQESAELAHAMRIQRFVQELPRYVFETMAVAGLVCVAVIVIARGGATERLVALLGVMALAAMRVMPSIVRILGALHQVRYHGPAITALHDDLVSAEPLPPESAPLTVEREIRLSHVTYSYPNANRPALDDVSLTIRKGETIAFIGSSGAGKTTLADLLIGLLEPTSGHIEVDGRRLDASLVRPWQRGIGYIPQNVFLTDETIRRNIAFGLPDDQIDERRVTTAMQAAQLDELVRSLPDGLDTLVGERGVRLSGGQRQRIGIARALYLDPAVLVLDEATSALDGLTEAEVVDAIELAGADRTTIVIAHRLSTVRKSDLLVWMSGGKIVNAGSWDSLLKENAEFRRLVEVTSQA